jgi:hypothetical protein
VGVPMLLLNAAVFRRAALSVALVVWIAGCSGQADTITLASCSFAPFIINITGQQSTAGAAQAFFQRPGENIVLQPQGLVFGVDLRDRVANRVVVVKIFAQIGVVHLQYAPGQVVLQGCDCLTIGRLLQQVARGVHIAD